MNWTRSLIVSLFLLICLRSMPVPALLLATVVLCAYVAGMLRKPVSYWVFLYPVVSYALAQGFAGYTFFEIGDGPTYFTVMDEIIPRLRGDMGRVLGLVAAVGPKYLNAGFLPTALLPGFLFDNPDAETYQLTQVFVHAGLVSGLLGLTIRWDVIREPYRTPVFLFMLISPGYLALVAYPTRHHLTSFGVFLFFISLEACLTRRTPGRAITLGLAVVLLFLCKAALLPFALLYSLVRLYQPHRFWLNLTMGSLLLGSTIYAYQYVRPFYDTRYAAETIGVFRGAWLGPLLPLYKYVMALISPFPYYKFGLMIDTIAYGGNWLLLSLFVPAGVIGLWLFGRMLFRPYRLWQYDADTKRLFGYGGIMSLSVLGGSTGFMLYILVFLPFFAPLFVIRDYPLPLVLIMLALLLLNGVVLLLNGDNLFDYL